MKLALAMTLFTLSFSVFAQSNNLDSQIEIRMETLSNKISNRAEHLRLNQNEKRELLEHLKESVKILNLSSTGPSNPGPGPGPQNPGPQYPTPSYGNTVEVFSDDRCSNLVTPITNRDSCNMLTNVFRARNVWSVRVNNVCYDTPDTNFQSACGSIQPLVNEPIISQPVVQLFKDDRCTSRLIDLDPAVNYNAWTPVVGGQNVWSLRVENKCIDFPDTLFNANLASRLVNDSLTMRGRPDPRSEEIELFADDRCSNSVTTVQRGNSCNALSTFYGSRPVWSIKFRGRCEDISDTTFAAACDTYAR
jgi:hypothetical protein